MHLDDTYKLTVVTHRKQIFCLISTMNCKNSIVYVQRRINTLLKQFQAFVKAYINDIVVRFKSLIEPIYFLRKLFASFVKKNDDFNSIKVFFDYFEITLLKKSKRFRFINNEEQTQDFNIVDNVKNIRKIESLFRINRLYQTVHSLLRVDFSFFSKF